MNRKTLSVQKKAIRVIYVSSYIPKRCGIATFTKDVTTAINMINPYALAEIMAIQKKDEDYEYPWEVKYKINQDDLESYLQAADYINKSGTDVVLIEHEFGLYGGEYGEYAIQFIEKINKPIVITCHTVIDDPNSGYGYVLRRILCKVSAVTTMLGLSAKKLITTYKVPENKIAVIPHGTPDLEFNAVSKFAKKFKNRVILGNINLISKRNGIEYTIEATAKIAKVIPNVLCLIVGQTHPNVIKYEGEKYRDSLKKLVSKLGIKNNVKFINEYVSIDDLKEWLKIIDYYVTPYLDPSQISSGALAYAVGAGKVCISTPYLYAKEVLGKNRGIIVPFNNSEEIAKTVLELENNFEKKNKFKHNAYNYGRFMTWPNVALQHLNLFEKVMKKNNDKNKEK